MGCLSFFVTLFVIIGCALLVGVEGILGIICWIIFGISAFVIMIAFVIGIIVGLFKALF